MQAWQFFMLINLIFHFFQLKKIHCQLKLYFMEILKLVLVIRNILLIPSFIVYSTGRFKRHYCRRFVTNKITGRIKIYRFY